MPRWVLNCHDCSQEFTHSSINPKAQAPSEDAFLWAGFDAKPDFPVGGLNAECPHCKQTSLYQRYQLLFRRDKM